MKTFIIASLILSSSGTFAYEEILGVMSDKDGVTFQVTSSGCTSKEHFRTTFLDTIPMGLILTREVPDPCDAHVPYGTTVKFSYEELDLEAGAEFVIKNPISIFQVHTTEKVKK